MLNILSIILFIFFWCLLCVATQTPQDEIDIRTNYKDCYDYMNIPTGNLHKD